MARTAITAGGPIAGFFWLGTWLTFVFLYARALVLGVTSGGTSEEAAWMRLVSNLEYASFPVISVTVLIGGVNCYAMAWVSLRRALYLSVEAPGTQAFKRFVRGAKVYTSIPLLPSLIIVGSFAVGIDAVRAPIVEALRPSLRA